MIRQLVFLLATIGAVGTFNFAFAPPWYIATAIAFSTAWLAGDLARWTEK